MKNSKNQITFSNASRVLLTSSFDIVPIVPILITLSYKFPKPAAMIIPSACIFLLISDPFIPSGTLNAVTVLDANFSFFQRLFLKHFQSFFQRIENRYSRGERRFLRII